MSTNGILCKVREIFSNLCKLANELKNYKYTFSTFLTYNQKSIIFPFKTLFRRNQLVSLYYMYVFIIFKSFQNICNHDFQVRKLSNIFITQRSSCECPNKCIKTQWDITQVMGCNGKNLVKYGVLVLNRPILQKPNFIKKFWNNGKCFHFLICYCSKCYCINE